MGPNLIMLAVAVALSFGVFSRAFQAGNGSPDSYFPFYTHEEIERVAFNNLARRNESVNSFGNLGPNDLKAVYFGNWLRDFSQINDVPFLKTVDSSVLLNAVKWMAEMQGFSQSLPGFTITMDRLGVYRPEEHVDSPSLIVKDYRSLIQGFRPPVSAEEIEYDELSAQRRYIQYPKKARNFKYTTLAFIRFRLWQAVIQMRSSNKLRRTGQLQKALEGREKALVDLGSALHPIEDFYAHSNFVELALFYRYNKVDVFPWVGPNSLSHCTGSHPSASKSDFLPKWRKFFGSSQQRRCYPLTTGTHDVEEGPGMKLLLYNSLRSAMRNTCLPPRNVLRELPRLKFRLRNVKGPLKFSEAFFDTLDTETSRLASAAEVKFRELANNRSGSTTAFRRRPQIFRRNYSSGKSWVRRNDKGKSPLVEASTSGNQTEARNFGKAYSSAEAKGTKGTKAHANRQKEPVLQSAPVSAVNFGGANFKPTLRKLSKLSDHRGPRHTMKVRGLRRTSSSGSERLSRGMSAGEEVVSDDSLHSLARMRKSWDEQGDAEDDVYTSREYFDAAKNDSDTSLMSELLDEALKAFPSATPSTDRLPNAGPALLSGPGSKFLILPKSTEVFLKRIERSMKVNSGTSIKFESAPRRGVNTEADPVVQQLPKDEDDLLDLQPEYWLPRNSGVDDLRRSLSEYAQMSQGGKVLQTVSDDDSSGEYNDMMDKHWQGLEDFPVSNTWSHYVRVWVVEPLLKWLSYRIDEIKRLDRDFFEDVNVKEVSHGLLNKDFPDNPLHEAAALMAARASATIMDEIQSVWSLDYPEKELSLRFNAMMDKVSQLFSHPALVGANSVGDRVLGVLDELYFGANATRGRKFFSALYPLLSKKSSAAQKNLLY